MELTNFDELNTLSTTETTKDDRRKVTRKKIPIHDYFENMQISEEEKEKRVRLANLLLADVLFLFALSRRNRDARYLSETFQKRYLSSVKKITEPDQKMQRYIRKVCDSIVKTTLKSGKDDGKKQGEALIDSDVIKVSQDSYAVSIERATSVAENEANAILNGEEYSNAVKNGCTKKRWKSYRDERVRADHADVDGQVVDISRPFRVGKYMMMYPKDDSLGAGLEEIVNCRCSVEYLYLTGGFFEKYEKRIQSAEQYYDSIRNRIDDIEKISNNTHISYMDVEIVKRHVFLENHILDDNVAVFDADYDMAVAWQRLINGTYEDRDIVLLKHELLESQVEKEYNLNYRDAHNIAQKKYPWSDIIDQMFGGEGEDVDLDRIIQEERR